MQLTGAMMGSYCLLLMLMLLLTVPRVMLSTRSIWHDSWGEWVSAQCTDHTCMCRSS